MLSLLVWSKVIALSGFNCSKGTMCRAILGQGLQPRADGKGALKLISVLNTYIFLHINHKCSEFFNDFLTKKISRHSKQSQF